MIFSFCYRMFKKVPVLGTVIKIINAYVYSGDLRSLDHIAPLRRWVKALATPISVAVILTLIMLHEHYTFPSLDKYDFVWNGSIRLLAEAWTPELLRLREPFDKPGQLITSAYPSLLGFGIGIYALVFVLAPKSMRLFQKQIDEEINSGARKEGHALMLNASMAYPLLVLTLSFIPAVLQQLSPASQILSIFTWIVFWYGIVVLIELIGLLFALGEQDGLDKIYPES